jgi:exodeoxyribonuclease III
VIDYLFPHSIFADRGYEWRIVNGQPMHHGVAIVSRIPIAADNRLDWQANGEARHLGVSLENGVRLENVYVPAGGDIPDREVNPKFGQKLDFLGRMTDWSKSLEHPTIVTGDFNIAPLECDVWTHKALLTVVSHTPIEIEALDQLQDAANWVDLGRHFVPPPEPMFTWWSYRAKDWSESNRGRRLDHMWATPDLAPAACAHRVHRDCRNWDKPSDHVPIVTEFAF